MDSGALETIAVRKVDEEKEECFCCCDSLDQEWESVRCCFQAVEGDEEDAIEDAEGGDVVQAYDAEADEEVFCSGGSDHGGGTALEAMLGMMKGGGMKCGVCSQTRSQQFFKGSLVQVLVGYEVRKSDGIADLLLVRNAHMGRREVACYSVNATIEVHAQT